MEVPSIQEMFNMAVKGLHSQGWERSIKLSKSGGQLCAYESETIKGARCAWGWVDTSLAKQEMDVDTLWANKIGIAYKLNSYELLFAKQLQAAHDEGNSPAKMKRYLLDLCESFKLDWPADVPQT